jgi:hypothetical protein
LKNQRISVIFQSTPPSVFPSRGECRISGILLCETYIFQGSYAALAKSASAVSG